MRLKLTATVIALAASFGAMAQQDPYYTHFMFNQAAFNPAFVGFKPGYICATAVHHQQWVSWEDQNPYSNDPSLTPTQAKTAPVTTDINISGRLANAKSPFANNLGLGVNVYNDKFGFYNVMAPQLALSYHFKVGGDAKKKIPANHNIGIGLNVGIMQSSLDGSKLTALDPGDPLIPTLSTGSTFDVGFGVYYHNPAFKKLTIGISGTHLTAPTINYSGGGTFPVARHFYLYGGLEQPIGGGGIVFKPSILVKQNTKMQADLNAMLEFRSKFWAGLSYRTGDNTNLMLGLNLFNTKNQSMKLGYSFDFTLTQVRKFSYGTHEIFLNYCFKLPTNNKEKPKVIRRSVRFL